LSLYAPTGERKYLNEAERGRVLAVRGLSAERSMFLLTLAWTGGRVSEVLALTPGHFQVEYGVVSMLTLKRRRHVIREVPIPPTLMKRLDNHFQLSARRRDPQKADRRLWPWHRTTAWRLVKRIMQAADVTGVRASPRGLRHAFGVATLPHVPPNIRQKWLGHARAETTNIYSAVCGPDEIEFAQRFWRGTERNE
jgi:integrase